MERMVNVKLLNFFEQKGIRSTLQCGGRAKRTIIGYILSLEAIVSKARANGEQVVFIFFDMEKVYYLTRRFGILIDIYWAGRERRIFDSIQNFIKPRSFKVKFNEILSDRKVQTEGIPQGSIVSHIFLILKINEIVAKLSYDNRIQISLYMDDLQIFYRHPNLKVV